MRTKKKKKQMPSTVRCNMVFFRGRPRAFVFLSSELRAASDKVGSPIESFTPAIPAQIFRSILIFGFAQPVYTLILNFASILLWNTEWDKSRIAKNFLEILKK